MGFHLISVEKSEFLSGKNKNIQFFAFFWSEISSVKEFKEKKKRHFPEPELSVLSPVCIIQVLCTEVYKILWITKFYWKEPAVECGILSPIKPIDFPKHLYVIHGTLVLLTLQAVFPYGNRATVSSLLKELFSFFFPQCTHKCLTFGAN